MIKVPDVWPRLTLMSALTRENQLALASLGTPMVFADKQILMIEGQRGDEIFLILDGFVKVTAFGVNGAETGLAIRPRGELVGEFAVLDSRPRSASVIACGSVVAVRIGRERFLAFFRATPEVAVEITRSVVRKLRSATDRRIDDRTRGVSEKLARVLLGLAVDYGAERDNGICIELALTQVDLAELAGVAESTAQAMFSQWRRDGVISTGYRRIVVRDMRALESRAEPGGNP
ncbi:Crp/Fnr family transcriptional regulator [Acrocarpospora sp. B8E8]|uniref:Crp/Fnr family transcriptional regulator n=1 Tax=Acrocarpospora sp. B8E8 TaxID=3153572 RepID=UPI00325F236E